LSATINAMENTQPKYHVVKDLKDGKYELTIKIPADVFGKSYKSVLEKKAETAKAPGFRAGKVPTKVLEDQLKQEMLAETFERLAPTFTYIAIGTEKLEPVSPVKYTKLPEVLELEKEVEYVVEVTTMPKFEMCDIKKIKVTKQPTDVTEKELQDTMDEMFKNQATGEKTMNDKWATDVAGRYGLKGITKLEKLKEEVKKLLDKQKKQIIETEFQKDIIREGIKLSKIVVPQEAIEYEAHEREHSFMHQLEQMKTTLEEYEKAYNITHEQLHTAWEADAKQAIEEHVFLNEYAKSQNIVINEDEFMQFVEQVKGDKEMPEDKNWLESLRSLYYKNKGFEKLLAAVKENLGIKDEKPKNDIKLVG
jgi:FKBP-type peptidyl-prolyl cis-trans isomerase (trigger factor)